MSDEKKQATPPAGAAPTPALPAGAVPQAPQPEADLDERLTKFNTELGPLLGKYELGLAGEAGIAPNGTIIARAVVVSTRGKKVEKEVQPETPSGATPAPKMDNPDA